MKKILLFTLILTSLSLGSLSSLFSQEKLVDEVVAIVGGNVVLMSDVETQYMQYRMQGNISGGKEMKCQILEGLLFRPINFWTLSLDQFYLNYLS